MPSSSIIALSSDCQVDLDTGQVRISNNTRQLRTKELELFRYLVHASPRVIGREELLREVWGYSEQAQSRTVEATMRRLRKAVELKPSDPVSLITVHGRGYRFEAEQVAETETSDCVGRGKKLAALQRLFAQSQRLVTVTGPGGIGKTTIATALLGATNPSHGLIDLSRCWDLPDILQTMATALGLSTEFGTVDAALDGLAYGLATIGPGLLVLDNGEQITAPLSRVVQTLRSRAPALSLLITSRIPLGLEEEHRFPLSALSTEASLTLLAQRASQLRPEFLHETGDLVRRQIIDELGGLPLAIVLAAAHTSRISPQQMLDALKRSSLEMEDTRKPLTHRHRSLSAALDWSWQLLTEDERTTLCAAAVFAAPFSLSQLAPMADLPLSPTADALGVLVDQAMVVQQSQDDGVRYRLPVEVRQYAQGRAKTVSPNTVSRHREWLVSQCVPGLRAFLTMEEILLLASLHEETREAQRNSEPGSLGWMTLVLATNALMRIRGPIEVRADLLATAIDALQPTVHDAQRAVLLERHSDALLALGEMSRARLVMLQAMKLARTTDQPVVESRALSRMGVIQVRRGERDEGLASARQGVLLAEQLSSPNYAPRAHSFLAIALMETGDLPSALAHFEEAAALSHPSDVGLRANVAAGLGNVHLGQHNYAEAEVAYHQAITLAEQLNSPLRVSRAAVMMGNLHHARGEWVQAAAAYEAGRIVYKKQGRRWEEAVAMTNKAVIDIHLGDLEQADAELQEALQIHTALGARQSQAVTHVNLGVVRCIQGDLRAAVQLITRAEKTFAALHPHSSHIARLLLVLTHVGANRDDLARDTLATVPTHTPDAAGLFTLANAALKMREDAAHTRSVLDELLRTQSDADVALAATMLSAILDRHTR